MISEKDIIICGHGSGTPRTIRMDTYLTSRYGQKMSNGKRKGLIRVRRLKKLTDSGRVKYHDIYKTILGRNLYSQILRAYCFTKYSDGKYYSDCSSSQCLTLRKAGYDISTLNTEGILTSSLFEDVAVKIVNGHITNPEVLKVGDLLLFAGNIDRPKAEYVGHVEGVYEINAGSGTNEKVESFQTWINKYYAAVVKTSIGKLLTVDGEYGEETRSGALAVWKYMANKYYGAKLDIKNHHFYGSCKYYAAFMTDAEIDAHETLEEIRDGVLAGRGYKNVKEYQAAKKISGGGAMNAATWYSLFN